MKSVTALYKKLDRLSALPSAPVDEEKYTRLRAAAQRVETEAWKALVGMNHHAAALLFVAAKILMVNAARYTRKHGR